MEDALKSKFIKILSEKGWNILAMRDASESLGLNPEYHNILFPDGVLEALNYLENKMDKKMIKELEASELPSKIREKIALALELRIIPFHIPSIKNAWRTADVIWRFAGDKSVDFNHYTKRALLSAVYIAAAKYRCNDNSVKAEDTKQYIIQNLDKIINIAGLKNKLPKLDDIPIVRYFI